MRSDEYIPTLGEYAEVIHWLVGHPNEEVPKEMRRVFNDAIDRAELRHFAAALLRLEAVPEWQLRAELGMSGPDDEAIDIMRGGEIHGGWLDEAAEFDG